MRHGLSEISILSGSPYYTFLENMLCSISFFFSASIILKAEIRVVSAYSGAYGIWQHSEKGSVDGINGNVDLDICYKDFPTIIKGKGLNGYGKEKALTNPPAPVSDDGISVEITVDGKKYSGKLNKA